MRHAVLIFILLFIFSCNESSPSISKERKSNSYKEYTDGTLLEEKFKEFYDLNVLLKEYPEFKEDIENRIRNFTTSPRAVFKLNDSLKIKNIRQKGSFIKVSDSVQMTTVYFDLISGKTTKTDSVIAFITKKKMIIDSEEVISTKVKFTRVVIQKFR